MNLESLTLYLLPVVGILAVVLVMLSLNVRKLSSRLKAVEKDNKDLRQFLNHCDDPEPYIINPIETV